jgi:molybdenum cofactor cytidylyltransferase
MRKQTATVCGVLLGAGLAKRFCGEKLLHPFVGRPLFSWPLQEAIHSKLAEIIFVGRQEILWHLPSASRVRGVCNPEPDIGQSHSMKLGLSHVPDYATHALFILADQPLITARLLNSFVGLADSGCEVACLGSGDYLGPPVLFGRNVFEQLTKIDGDSGAKKILMRYEDSIIKIPAQFAGQEADIDCQKDIANVEKIYKTNSELIASAELK